MFLASLFCELAKICPVAGLLLWEMSNFTSNIHTMFPMTKSLKKKKIRAHEEKKITAIREINESPFTCHPYENNNASS